MATFFRSPVNLNGTWYSSLTGVPVSSPMSKVSSAEIRNGIVRSIRPWAIGFPSKGVPSQGAVPEISHRANCEIGRGDPGHEFNLPLSRPVAHGHSFCDFARGDAK